MNDVLSAVSAGLGYLVSILYLGEGYLFYRVLCCMVKRREGKLWGAAVFFSCTVLSSMVIFPNDLFNVTLDLIWFLIMMFLAFHGSVWQKLAAVAVLYPLIISQNFLLLDMLGRFDLRMEKKPMIDIFCTAADITLHLLFWYLVLGFFEKKLARMERLFDDRTWILLGSICLASMVSITTCICFSPEKSYWIWPAALACLVTNLGSLFLAEYFTISIQRNMERKNLELQKSYYEELERNQTAIRKLRHDMNNHLGVIHSLFRSGNQEEAEQYLSELEAQITVQNRRFCKNSIVNAVLNAKYSLAMEQGIDCFFHIDLQHFIGIDPVSLCCLFANTLDNAIEASVKIPEPENRHLSVKARVTENGYFTYEITNTKRNTVSEQKGTFQTDKENASAHGFGLGNVREMVERYSGTIDISCTDDTFTVTVLIGNV